MGGAFTAVADDWTAIYWNPAGLTQLREDGYGLTVDPPRIRVRDGNSVANGGPFFPMVYTTPVPEPARFNKETAKTSPFLPGVCAYKVWRDTTVALGGYAAVGGALDWSDQISDPPRQGTITGNVHSEVAIAVYSLCAAHQCGNGLSLGLGLNVLDGTNEFSAAKDYASSIPLVDYSFSFGQKAEGQALEWVLGALWKVNSQWQLGAVYRSGASVDLDGSASSAFTTEIGLGAFSEKSSYVQTFRQPKTYGLGVAYRPDPKKPLLLSADLLRTDWSSSRLDIDYATEGAALVDVNRDLNWDRTTRLRLGGEYRYDAGHALRAGYAHDPAAMPDQGVDLTQGGIDVDRNFFSLGYEFPCHRGKLVLTALVITGDRAVGGEGFSYKARSLIVNWEHPF